MSEINPELGSVGGFALKLLKSGAYIWYGFKAESRIRGLWRCGFKD